MPICPARVAANPAGARISPTTAMTGCGSAGTTPLTASSGPARPSTIAAMKSTPPHQPASAGVPEMPRNPVLPVRRCCIHDLVPNSTISARTYSVSAAALTWPAHWA